MRRVAMISVAWFAALSTAGCFAAIKPHVPEAYAGNVPLTVVNATSSGLCEYRMMAVGKGAPQHDNWLGKAILDAHKQQEFRVQPGTYSVEVEGCYGAFVGKTSMAQVIRVEGPTWVSIGGRTRAPKGFKEARVAVHRAAQTGGDEDESAEETPAETHSDCVADGHVRGKGQCCSPLSSQSNGVVYCDHSP